MFHYLTFSCHCFTLHVSTYMAIFKCVGYFYFHIPKRIFTGFFSRTFPSVRWVKYEVLLFMLFLHCYSIYVFYLCFSSLILLFLACAFACLFCFVLLSISCSVLNIGLLGSGTVVHV
jgi:hypothetical protein